MTFFGLEEVEQECGGVSKGVGIFRSVRGCGGELVLDQCSGYDDCNTIV